MFSDVLGYAVALRSHKSGKSSYQGRTDYNASSTSEYCTEELIKPISFENFKSIGDPTKPAASENRWITEYGDLRWLEVYDPKLLKTREVNQYKSDVEDHIRRRIADRFQEGRKQESLYVHEQLHKAHVLELRIRRRPFFEDLWWGIRETPPRSNIDLAESCELSGNLFGAELFLEDYLAHFEAQEDAVLLHDEPRDFARIVQKLSKLYDLSKKRIDKLDSYFNLSLPDSALSSSFILDRAARIDSKQFLIRLYQDSVVDPEVFDEAALFAAARHNACTLAEFALDRGSNANCGLYSPHTALHEAVFHGHIDMVKLLVARGAHIESETRHSMTPLHRAASRGGNISLVMFLLWKGARIEARDEDRKTPLYHAVTTGNLDIVRYFLENGARTSTRPRDSLPIHAATEGEYSDILELLLEHGADIAAKNDKGDTALHFAVKCEVKINSLSHGFRDCISTLLRGGLLVDVRGNHGETPLHRAASQHRSDIVKLLLQEGASVTAEADNGTPLHYAIHRTRGPGIVTPACDVVNSLLDSGAVVNFQRQSDRKTPLHLAGQCVNEDQTDGLNFLRLLLDQGGDVFILDNSRMTAIDYLRPNEAAVNWLAKYMQGSAV
ncbi:MAG: hypothetical protein Q9171_005541 [Xanthocarpia ochracea]